MQALPVLYDVVVVGAGLAGAAVAHRLAADGKRVLVLEARDQVGGMSADGCGLALLGTTTPYTTLVERRGAEDARHIWALTQENLELLETVADEVEVPVRRVGSFRATDDSVEATTLESSREALEAIGVTAKLEDATELGYLVGLRTDDDLAFEPLVLINALLDHANIVLRTDVEVQALKEGDGHVDFWAHRHSVRAQRAVLTAGPHSVHLNDGLREVFSSAPMHSLRAKSQESLARPWVLEAGKVLLCDVGDHWRMAAWSQEDDEEPWTMLVRTGERFFPEAPVSRQRAGWIARTPDDVPVIGRAPGCTAVYVVGGLGAWGAQWAFVAADRLAQVLDGEAAPALLSITRWS